MQGLIFHSFLLLIFQTSTEPCEEAQTSCNLEGHKQKADDARDRAEVQSCETADSAQCYSSSDEMVWPRNSSNDINFPIFLSRI